MGRTINTILNLKDNFSTSLKKASQNTNKFQSDLYKANKASNNIIKTFGNVSKAAFSLGTALAGAVGVSGGILTKNFIDYDNALRQAASSTAATKNELSELGEVIQGVYASNFGESWEDVANSVAEVKKNIGGTPAELKKITENAIALRDTFGYELQESTRAVDMMMKQFGITSDEAFNLIAQGSQAGLDKNGNLLDSLNEYSVHFKQLGFDAEEMFNVLASGNASGVFDIDKIGDAVKEFGIRAKDGSDTTIEGFKLLGLNAEEMQKAFAEGGKASTDAFFDVWRALEQLDDPIKRNTAGVNLFGTMWEDMGEDAVLAAMDMGDAFNGTIDTMGQINDIKYSSFSESIKGISRQLEVAALPIGEKLLPYLNDFANFLNENLPSAINKFTEFIDANLGPAIEKAKAGFENFKNVLNFLKENMNTIIPIVAGLAGGFAAFVIITKVVMMFNTFRKATQGLTIAQALLNTTMLGNPITWIAIGIGLLIAAFIMAYKNSETFRNKINELWNTLQPFVQFIGAVFSAVFVSTFNTITNQAMNFITMIGGVLEGIIMILNGIITFVVGVFTGNWEMAWQGISDIFSGIFIGIQSIAKGIVNGIINTINGIISGINSLADKASTIPGLGWAEAINIPLIPTFAKGTNWFGGGIALVGEEGPELVNLPSGSSVKTANETRTILQNKNPDVSVNVHIHGNFYGNDKAADELGEKIVDKVIIALGNI